MASVRRCAGASAGALFLAAVPAVARAQTGTISGRVVDSVSQQGVPSVNVILVGTTIGTETRPDGSFTLARVPVGARAVRVARIGFAAQTHTVDVTDGGTATLNFRLGALVARLSEVVVAQAYSGGGGQDRRNVTGSVAAVDSTLFNKGRVDSPEQLIQAKVPGVQVVSDNSPGGSISVRIRGQASVNGVTDPLFVVDGIPIPVGGGLSAGRNPLNFLNPQDIANITVLKDAQATAIYGSRGANGVVLITTKNGTQGGPQVTYGSNYSNRSIARTPSYVGADQYRQIVQQYAPANVSVLGNANTNWLDAVKQTGGGTEQNFAVGGTRQDLQYRLSLNYLTDNGVLKGDNTKRVSGQFNYADRLFHNVFDVQATLRAVRTYDNYGAGSYLADVYGYPSTQPIYNPDGSFYEINNFNAANNPLARLAATTNKGQTDRGIGNLQLRANAPFLTGLSGTVRGSFDAARSAQTIFTPTTDPTQRFVIDSLQGSYFQNLPEATTLVLDAYSNYVHRLESARADLDLTAGYSYETFRGNNAQFTSIGLSTNALGTGGIPSATRTFTPAVNVQESRLASFFARANATIADKYLVGFSVRRDGSSRFGTNNQWGNFPAASVGWRLSEESFLKDRLPGVSDLKLRYSYGLNGNQPFANYLAQPTYSYSSAQSEVQFGNTFVPTIQPSAANPNLKWEQSATHDLGLDYALFRGRVSGTFDYYNKKTTNLLFNVPVASGTNFSNYVLENIGSLRNAGFEAGLNVSVLQGGAGRPLGGLRYDANFAASTNRNRVLSISGAGGASRINTGDIGFQTVAVVQPGLPINTYYVFRHVNDANGNPVVGPNTTSSGTDATKYYVDQNHDGQIDQNDLVPFHSPQPRWILGHTSNFALGRADLSFTLRSYLGYWVYNAVASTQGSYSVVQQGGAPRALNTAALKYNFVTSQVLSDLYVENANFLRMDNVTLGYSLPAYRAFRSTRVFATVQNVFTATKYSGVDPLAAGLGGIDQNAYPLTRIFTLGLNLGF
ncbi:SusC/RagA family TonB-linked outer membrane protein [Gemmatimonadetes bacterium T265]|nr:SusC/RagA family TonB-linked outer membrane protein [Gemmatimonadetes bacterium T265]